MIHKNIPNMIASITSAVRCNIENMGNRSKGDYAYTIIDTAEAPTEANLDELRAIEGMISIRTIWYHKTDKTALNADSERFCCFLSVQIEYRIWSNFRKMSKCRKDSTAALSAVLPDTTRDDYFTTGLLNGEHTHLRGGRLSLYYASGGLVMQLRYSIERKRRLQTSWTAG